VATTISFSNNNKNNNNSNCVLLICVSGKEKISFSKSDALNVSAVATACEESYRTGLPVHLSVNNDGLVTSDVEKCLVVNGDVIIDDIVVKSNMIVQ